MSWRFRQSFKIIPGVRLNLSSRGLSASIGGTPFTINVGPKGVYGTASIPGTGVSFRQRLDYPEQPSRQPKLTPGPQSKPRGSSPLPELKEIRSASTEVLTSEGLKELKLLIQTAYEEQEDINEQLLLARKDENYANRRFNSWNNGFLFKKLFKNAFAARQSAAELSIAKAAELAEQLRLTSIAVHVELAREQADPYFKMRDDFQVLTDCQMIWNIDAERKTDRVRERSNTEKAVQRESVRLSLGTCDLVHWEESIPHFKNNSGGDLYIYPGFILYRAARTAFSVIDCHDVKLVVDKVSFNEREVVPSDSQIVGETWSKINKDGSPDRRFANNQKIPIACYGEIIFTTVSGLEEVFMVSNPLPALNLAKSWLAFVGSFDNQSSCTVQKQEVATPTESEDVRVACPYCGQHMVVSAEEAGREFECPNCKQNIRVTS